jgi:hypothetical protein
VKVFRPRSVSCLEIRGVGQFASHPFRTRFPFGRFRAGCHLPCDPAECRPAVRTSLWIYSAPWHLTLPAPVWNLGLGEIAECVSTVVVNLQWLSSPRWTAFAAQLKGSAVRTDLNLTIGEAAWREFVGFSRWWNCCSGIHMARGVSLDMASGAQGRLHPVHLSRFPGKGHWLGD